MTNKAKRKVRDIQDQTGWKYTFCQFLVSELGYAVVSEAVDACPLGDRKAYETLGDQLNEKARAAQKAKGL